MSLLSLAAIESARWIMRFYATSLLSGWGGEIYLAKQFDKQCDKMLGAHTQSSSKNKVKIPARVTKARKKQANRLASEQYKHFIQQQKQQIQTIQDAVKAGTISKAEAKKQINDIKYELWITKGYRGNVFHVLSPYEFYQHNYRVSPRA